MYPNLSDLFNDLFGTDMQLPLKTFGFFLALAFISAYLAIKADLQRREKLGQFKLLDEKIKTEGPMTLREVGIFAAVWALVGYKLFLAFTEPELFNADTEAAIFSLRGSWLGFLIVGLVAGAFKYNQYQKRKGQEEKYETIKAGPSHYMGTIVTIAFVAGILGSKLAAMLEPGSSFYTDPIGNLMSFNGLSFYGGLLLAGALIIWYIRRKGFDLMTAADAFAPGLILAYAVGRIGCQLAGDGDWGIVNEAPMPDLIAWLPEWVWTFDYPHNVANEGELIPGCTGQYCRQLVPSVYPTPFYETLMGLAIFGVLWLLRKRMTFAGQIAGIYLVLNGLERFLIEKIRVNGDYDILGFDTTQAEFIAILLMIGGVVLFAYATRIRRLRLAGQS